MIRFCCKSLLSVLFGATLFLLASTAANSQADHSKQDGPYYVEGIDVACGVGGRGQDWHRYMIGSDGNAEWLFGNMPYYGCWIRSTHLPGANKIISYKLEGCGYAAYCSVYDYEIWETDDGGHSWRPINYPRSGFNLCFTTIEILNTPQGSGRTIFVGTEAHENLPTANYTTDWGYTWHRLGGNKDDDPIYGITITDIESMVSGELVAGTVDGIFRHDDNYDSPWVRAAFEADTVTAIDNIDVGVSQQVAAVVTLREGRKLFYTTDGWASDIRELRTADRPFSMNVRDLSAVYWGESRISCYLACDQGGFLLAFDETKPADARLIDLGSVNPAINSFGAITAVDYHIDYADGDNRASVIMAGKNGVYEVREYRRNPAVIDSIIVTEFVEGTFWAGEVE